MPESMRADPMQVPELRSRADHDLVHTACAQTSTTRVQEERLPRQCPTSCGRRRRAKCFGARQVGSECCYRLGTHRDEALIPTLAGHTHHALRYVEVITIETHQLAHPNPCRIEHLQDGDVA